MYIHNVIPTTDERTELLKTFKDLPEKMQKVQTENTVLRTEVEKLRDRELAWAPLVQAGLARGRKTPNVAAAATAAAGKAANPDTTESVAASVPQPKSKLRKRIFKLLLLLYFFQTSPLAIDCCAPKL